MSSLGRGAIPWVCVLLALPVGLLVLYETAPVACNELPTAFSRGFHTEQSETLEVVASHCETTRVVDRAASEKTIVNWSGLVFAIALWVGAWLVGAGLVHVVDRRRGLAGAALAGVVATGALVVFFV